MIKSKCPKCEKLLIEFKISDYFNCKNCTGTSVKIDIQNTDYLLSYLHYVEINDIMYVINGYSKCFTKLEQNNPFKVLITLPHIVMKNDDNFHIEINKLAHKLYNLVIFQ